MRATKLITWMAVAALLSLGIVSSARAQHATFSNYNDASASHCYNPATTAPDATNLNRLIIGMLACTAAAPNGTTVIMDSFSFRITAPAGYYVSKVTFTQNGTSGGSRGGAGYRAATWVVDDEAFPVSSTTTGWEAIVDLSLQRKSVVPVSITTFLAAFGITVVSGSASASSPAVVVELLPL